MRKLILKMSVSVDGFVAGPKGESDWIFSTNSDDADAWTLNCLKNASLHLMGSTTYYDMKAYWPYSTDDYAPVMNDIPKAIFTRKGLDINKGAGSQSLKDATDYDRSRGVSLSATSDKLDSWLHPMVMKGDINKNIQQLKQEGNGYMVAHGGAGFARSLIQGGLVDEFQLLVHPVVLGKGMPIFTELAKPSMLELVSSERFEKGALGNTYRPVK